MGLTVGLITIVDFEFEIANLPIHVEPEAGGTAELEHFAPRAPVVTGAVPDSLGIVAWIPIEFVVLNARDTFGLYVSKTKIMVMYHL